MKTFALSRLTAAMGLMGAGSAWACNTITVTYAGAAASAQPVAVPSLSMLGVAGVAVGLGVAAWRKRKVPGARALAVVLLAGAGLLANEGGGGLIQKAYAAAVNIDLTNPAGGSQAVSMVMVGDTLTLNNTSGGPLTVTDISPIATSCGAGTQIPAGGSCTTPVSMVSGVPVSLWNGVTCLLITPP